MFKAPLLLFDVSGMIDSAIGKFFAGLFDGIIKFFSKTLADIMSSSLDVLNIPLVKNGIIYSQTLAFTILVVKVINEAYQTYILRQNGDPDADPAGLLVRTCQAVAVITTLPWIVQQLFTFGTKVSKDVAGLNTGSAGVADWAFLTALITSTGGAVISIFCIVLVIMMIIVAIQSTIRGAELALMAVLGPIMALNLTANNRSIWSAWFRQLIIICTAQALQIFMLSGAISLLTSQAISSNGLLLVFGWLWVTVKSPKYIQQFAYSTGLTSTIGGTAKQAGSMAVMRMMMSKGG